MSMLEPEEEHDGGSPLYLRPHEIIHDKVPALYYLVRLRIVEFQDCHTPPSSDEDYGYNDDEDSDNSKRSPIVITTGSTRVSAAVVAGARGRGQLASPGRMSLAWVVGLGPLFGLGKRGRLSLWEISRSCRRVVPCPVALQGAGFSPHIGRVSTSAWMLGLTIELAAEDPMVDEAALCTPRMPRQDTSDSEAPHSIDIWPRAGRSSRAARPGIVGAALEDEVDLLRAGRMRPCYGPLDGPDCLFGCEA